MWPFWRAKIRNFPDRHMGEPPGASHINQWVMTHKLLVADFRTVWLLTVTCYRYRSLHRHLILSNRTETGFGDSRTPENQPTCLCHGPDKNLTFGVNVCAESGHFGAKFCKMYVSESRQFGVWCKVCVTVRTTFGGPVRIGNRLSPVSNGMRQYAISILNVHDNYNISKTIQCLLILKTTLNSFVVHVSFYIQYCSTVVAEWWFYLRQADLSA